MTIKKTKEFSRFEWTKNRGSSMGDIFEGKYGGLIRERKDVIGEYDVSSLVMKQKTRDEIKNVFNNTYRRLVPCSVYGKLYGFMRGKPAYSGSRIYDMALNGKQNRKRNTGEKENLNYFIIGGIMFILMTPKEYDVYLAHDFAENRKYKDVNFRKYLMSHPKTKEANERIEKERLEAEKMWKTGREDNEFGIDMAYHGPEWDYFFTEVFPTWENKFNQDSVPMWCDAAGYYHHSNEGAVKKVRFPVNELWSEYKKWCVGQRYTPLYVKQFSVRMKEMGFMKRSGSGVRAFDVFVGSSVNTEKWELAKAEREAVLREKMLARITELKIARDDTEFLDGLIGRFQAAQLWSRYEDFCRSCGKQLGFGKRNFYKFLDEAGFKRETVGGTLYMEKK